jgi:phosphohistidine phosphatase
MNLYLLRHGLAAEPGAKQLSHDADRPLTAEGERKLRKIAKAMRQLELNFDWILSSPYLRAHQTAKIIVEALDLGKRLELSDHLTPAGSVKKMIEMITHRRPSPDEVLLVGHEPYLSELVSLLVSGSNEICVVMKKGGLCKMSIEAFEYGRCATLEWLLTPKQMCLIA